MNAEYAFVSRRSWPTWINYPTIHQKRLWKPLLGWPITLARFKMSIQRIH